MKYSELAQYPLHWVFQRADMGLSDDDRAAIHPLTPHYARQVWQQQVSTDAVDLERLEEGDWLSQASCWPETALWEEAFESDDPVLPEALQGHLNWDPNTIVFICYDQEHVLETRYSVFRHAWKAFLFAADQALVVGRRRNEALWFVDERQVKLGQKP
ncbi:DUF2947 family protein [Ferrimonas marina]|uniref:DUF2947 domain-containing protein n=1 Tax=Ferrimonas marina TaxID=299255 RepID=A0A1M5VVB7_9GAMM|nr:DUF2947 family protein [Ferrimonas marina]SHH78934.1 Protein of unknown function [Ferrimonas marina]